MAVLHDFRCDVCDREFESVVEAATLPAGPPCPTCGGPTTRVFLPPPVRWTPNAVVVYQAPDGSFRFPGATDGASTAKYDRLGYTRVEARGFAEVRHLEQRLNRQERAQMERIHERREQLRASGESMRRSDLRQRMQGMSRLGRDVARAAQAQTDARPSRRVNDPGVHVEAYSNTRSNRDGGRGRD